MFKYKKTFLIFTFFCSLFFLNNSFGNSFLPKSVDSKYANSVQLTNEQSHVSIAFKDAIGSELSGANQTIIKDICDNLNLLPAEYPSEITISSYYDASAHADVKLKSEAFTRTLKVKELLQSCLKNNNPIRVVAVDDSGKYLEQKYLVSIMY